MNFQQLRIIREAVRRDFNLTEAANALYTSQSGVSKHIKDLEDELGVELFVRHGKRLLGLTEPGKEIAATVERVLRDTENLKRIAGQFASREQGSLTLATTHTQARYALPDVVKRFKTRYPRVHLALHQCSPREIVEMLLAGEADIGVATEAVEGVPELASFPCYSWHHALIVPRGHPLAAGTVSPEPSFADIAAHPIVTYHAGFTGRACIDAAFAAAGLAPDIVLSAIDADVIKTYVELGLGVGIVAPMAYDPVKDAGLVLIPCPHLFPANTTRVVVHRGVFLRDYAREFVAMVAPDASFADWGKSSGE
jgi:LysR family cys regulon transcriptional activator